jgi:hypothetical protein
MIITAASSYLFKNSLKNFHASSGGALASGCPELSAAVEENPAQPNGLKCLTLRQLLFVQAI